MRHIEINDERYNKGLRIRYKIFNEIEFTETNIICRNAVCANIKQTRIITIPKIDSVNKIVFFSKLYIVIVFFLNSIG
jgi:hypothetical protein